MAIKVGSLFIDLVTNGAKQSADQLGTVGKSMAGVKKISLEAKLAVLGVVAGLSKIITNAGQTGTSLKLFSSLTGQSAETLQRWQGVGRQFNVTNENMQSSVGGLSTTISKALDGFGEMPAKFGIFMSSVKVDPNRMRDTFYLMEKLQEFATDQSIGRGMRIETLRDAGMSDDVISSMMQGVYTKQRLAAIPIIKESQIEQLSKMNAMWNNIWTNMQMATANLVAGNGGKIVAIVGKMTAEFMMLVGAIVKLADKLKIFDFFIEGLKTIATLLKVVVGLIDDLATKGLKKTIGDILTPSSKYSLLGQAQEFLGFGGKSNQQAPNISINQNINLDGRIGSLKKSDIADAAKSGSMMGLDGATKAMSSFVTGN